MTTPWADATDAAALWADAPALDPALVDRLLLSATEACQAYAPALAVDATPPERYVQAVVLHARDLHRASMAREDGSIGPDGYVLRPRPLSATVLQLLRPRRAVPRFGVRRSTA